MARVTNSSTGKLVLARSIISLVAGTLFGIGLTISGMTQLARVIGFLDFFGTWDPSLMFVMMGAILAHFWSYWLFSKRPGPLFDQDWHIPEKKDGLKMVMIGSAIFGVGWGLGGLCPGSAWVSSVSFDPKILWFLVGLFAGQVTFYFLETWGLVRR